MGGVPTLGGVFQFCLLEIAVVVVIEIGCKGNKVVPMAGINTGGFHDTDQHVLTELHLGNRCILAIGFSCRFFGGFLFRSILGFVVRLRNDRRQVVGFNFVAEVNTVEPVEGLSVNFTAAFDVKRDLEAFALLDLRDVPNNVETALAFFRRHGNVVALTVGVLQFPFLDLKLRRKHVVDVKVAERRVTVVFEQNEDLVAPFASERDGLLSGAEVAAVVDDLDAG